ncbi:hypothetical protein GEMRC1_002285 [Eukaryota sp. GEM-RC1]
MPTIGRKSVTVIITAAFILVIAYSINLQKQKDQLHKAAETASDNPIVSPIKKGYNMVKTVSKKMAHRYLKSDHPTEPPIQKETPDIKKKDKHVHQYDQDYLEPRKHEHDVERHVPIDPPEIHKTVEKEVQENDQVKHKPQVHKHGDEDYLPPIKHEHHLRKKQRMHVVEGHRHHKEKHHQHPDETYVIKDENVTCEGGPCPGKQHYKDTVVEENIK